MTRGLAGLLLAACLVSAGCDGSLKLSGQVVGPTGTPMARVPVYLFVSDRADTYDPVLWTDAQGRFGLQRTDCTCDFPIELIATHPDFGIGRHATTHKALGNGDSAPIVIRLMPRPKPPSYGEADQASPPNG
ncbi:MULTISPECIES: hypothetical protein [unclassified Lysobacter]|uniref:hypothetical protein n=1 Tax=unclassified Lysobacter TaxID=2635362 RepID=UPI0006FA6560|nr:MULTISPECIES: hypothetical protein [unclassified Lysobacter]KRA17768.1 hypothetical protein ASD69_13980 [Lysobacter sp. Root604]KRD34105.1 hypothetical protein ASE35_10205 [Lysobacter sp. Root916]KRD77447.1 hypothetical protein ASE43_09910 [Lysobacter sp. Root983]